MEQLERGRCHTTHYRPSADPQQNELREIQKMKRDFSLLSFSFSAVFIRQGAGAGGWEVLCLFSVTGVFFASNQQESIGCVDFFHDPSPSQQVKQCGLSVLTMSKR